MVTIDEHPGTSPGDGSRVERYAEAMAEADGGPDLGCFSEDYIDHARAAIAVADHEQAELEARVAELEATVAKVRERAQQWCDGSTELGVIGLPWGKDLLAILDAPKDTTAPSEGGH